MTAISRGKVTISIVDAGVDPSDVASTDQILGEIKTYAKSGGEKDLESDPVFGGYVDKEKPTTQVELNFEIIPSLEYADRWDAWAYGEDVATGVYTMSDESLTNKAVFIEATDGTNPKSWGFNNCNVTVFDFEHNADDNQTGNFNLKFSPTTSDGVSNFMTKASLLTDMPDWDTLDNN